MLLSTMTRSEIAKHLTDEVYRNYVRLLKSIHRVCKKMIRYRRTQFSFIEMTRNKTEPSIYIIDPKQETVSFYHSHFFDRYAERSLRKSLSLKLSSELFIFNTYFFGIYMEEEFSSSEGVGTLAIIFADGVGLGVYDLEGFVVVNSFLSNELLFENQIIIADKIRNALTKGSSCTKDKERRADHC